MRQRSASLVAALVAALIVTTSPAVAEDVAPPAMPPVPAGASDQTAAPALGGRSVIGALAGLGARVADGIAGQVAQAVSVAASNPCSGTGSTLKKTSNGSLTVLLLGSDYRTGAWSERTDTVIVANIAKNGRVAMAAIPRDTVQVPLASGGTSGASRVNTLYQRYKRAPALGGGAWTAPRSIACGGTSPRRWAPRSPTTPSSGWTSSRRSSTTWAGCA